MLPSAVFKKELWHSDAELRTGFSGVKWSQSTHNKAHLYTHYHVMSSAVHSPCKDSVQYEKHGKNNKTEYIQLAYTTNQDISLISQNFILNCTTNIPCFSSIHFAFSLCCLPDCWSVGECGSAMPDTAWLTYTSIASSSEANWEISFPSQPTLHRETETYEHVPIGPIAPSVHVVSLKHYRVINALAKPGRLTKVNKKHNKWLKNFCLVVAAVTINF